MPRSANVRPNAFAAATYCGRAPLADAQNTATLLLPICSLIHPEYICARDIIGSQAFLTPDNTMRIPHLPLRLAALVLTTVLGSTLATAQNKGEPGNFDFYLMNLSWSPEFCSIQGTSPECAARPGFILHGLWTQNNDGTYPVFCTEEPAPANLAESLDITPDLALLQHEWAKHGTCSAVGPQRFFAMEHEAFYSLKIPAAFEHIDHEISLAPDAILQLFAEANPNFPQGSILLSCGRNHLTAIEACFSKDLHPIVCQGLHTCRANSVKITPPAPAF
jgi:ribonuclease T2